MEHLRSALDAARKLPDAQAERVLRELLGQAAAPEEEGRVRYALALCLLHQKKHAEARDALENAVRLLNDESERALAFTALARACFACGDLKKSLNEGRKARLMLRDTLSPDDARLAPSLFSLSFAEYEARNLECAEQLCLEARELWEKQLGPENLELSTCLNNLGRIYEEMGREEDGIAHHRKALAIRRKVLGDHPETAFSMGNLGTALAAAGKWEEAAAVLEEAIACYARCGHAEGRDIEGYRRNLNVCRKALAETRGARSRS